MSSKNVFQYQASFELLPEDFLERLIETARPGSYRFYVFDEECMGTTPADRKVGDYRGCEVRIDAANWYYAARTCRGVTQYLGVVGMGYAWVDDVRQHAMFASPDSVHAAIAREAVQGQPGG